MSALRRIAALAALIVPAVAGAQPADPGPARIAAAERHTVPLAIVTPAGTRRYRVERATTPDMQELGLMYRRHMAPRHGMIFPMQPPRMASFWMKNTFIPLDILFIRPDGRISSIAPAQALSTALVNSTEPVGAVLELNAGAAARDGLHPGDAVRW